MPTPAPRSHEAMEPMPTPAPPSHEAMEPMPTPAPRSHEAMEPMPTPAPQTREAAGPEPEPAPEERDFEERLSARVAASAFGSCGRRPEPEPAPARARSGAVEAMMAAATRRIAPWIRSPPPLTGYSVRATRNPM